MQNSGVGVNDTMPGALSSGIPNLGSAGMMGVGVGGGMNPVGIANNPPLPTVPLMANPEGAQQFCLRWNSYPATVATQLAALRAAEDFVDVTLACDGRQLRAHKLVLSACSPYFMQLFKSTPCQHPVIFLRDVGFRQLVALLEFMYAGEVNVSQVELPALLRTAEALQVRGLADTNPNNGPAPPSQQTIPQPPQQQQQKQTFSPHYAPIVNQQQQQQLQQQQQQPVMPTPPPTAPLPSVDESQGQCNQEPPTQSPNPSGGPVAKRVRRDERSSPVNLGAPKIEEDENSSDSNDSQDFGEVGEEEMKAYMNDGSISENLEESGEVFPGTEDPGGDPFDITQADLGSDAVGGSQSEVETSEEEDGDDDEDGECKGFTYQSDASYSQEPGGNSNSNGESAAGPSGIGGSSGDGGSAGTIPGGSKEPGEIPTGGTGGGSGRNRLSRSLWPPGIPYHGPQQCPYCPRILSNVGNWRKHVLTMHFAREKNYKCRHCASCFRTAEYLQKHYVRVHNYPQKMTRRKYVENT